MCPKSPEVRRGHAHTAINQGLPLPAVIITASCSAKNCLQNLNGFICSFIHSTKNLCIYYVSGTVLSTGIQGEQGKVPALKELKL